MVKLLLSKGALVNAKNATQYTPLHEAAYSGRTDIAKILIKKGGKVNAKDISQATPLHYAALAGNTDVAKVLIENGAPVNARNEKKQTPAMVADENNHVELAADDPRTWREVITKEKRNLIMRKIFCSLLLMSVAMLVTVQALAGDLHDAAEHGELARLRQLIAQGAEMSRSGTITKILRCTRLLPAESSRSQSFS